MTQLSNDYTTSTYIFDAVHPDTGFTRYELGYTAQDMDPTYQEEVEQILTAGNAARSISTPTPKPLAPTPLQGIPIEIPVGRS